MDLTPGLDPEETEEILAGFIAAYVEGAGADGVVVGLSGGLDSAVTATLAAGALGPDRVLCLLLPSDTTPDDDVADAEDLVERLGCPSRTVAIDPVVEAYRAVLAGAEGDERGERSPKAASDDAGRSAEVALGNVMARARMVVLYHHANRLGYLVCGTGNKSELLTGYFTKHGDGGVDLLPLGDLYKTQVRRLAEHLDVPKAILDKAPSAGLVEGQTDEDELGLPYPDLDRVLRGIEFGYAVDEIAEATGLDEDAIRAIAERERRSRHKRRSPMVPKLGARSAGTDWREKVV